MSEMEVKRNYEVLFEIYGKRMKTTVLANSAKQAKERVIEKISFHKVEVKKEDVFNEAMDIMNDVIGNIKSRNKTNP